VGILNNIYREVTKEAKLMLDRMMEKIDVINYERNLTMEDVQQFFLKKVIDKIPDSNIQYVSQIDKMMEQIKKDGINTKEFRNIMNTYNKSIKDAARVNINQTKITKNF